MPEKKMQKCYTLGLDVGIASLGWAVINLKKNAQGQLQPKFIAKMGVRIFTKAENPKTGESLALPRRMARGQRRRIYRRAQRMNSIKKLLVSSGMILQSELPAFFQLNSADLSPWQLRYEGLNRVLSPREWARVLVHLAKHRGFKSNRRGEANSDHLETKGLIAEVAKNAELLKAYRTTGEMFYLDEKCKHHKRNQEGEYHHTVGRKELLKEIDILFHQQREFGNRFAVENLQEVYIQIFSQQRPFSNKNQLLILVGHCTFERGEKRIPKACFSAEYFVALQKLNHLKIREQEKERSLTVQERSKLIAEAQELKKISYSQAAKILGLSDATGFNITDDAKTTEKTLIEFRAYHILKSAISKTCGKAVWNSLAADVDRLDALAFELTFCKQPEEAHAELKKAGFENLMASVAEISFDKVLHLSRKALLKIIPALELGLRYDEACLAAGYQHSEINTKTRQPFLPSLARLSKQGEDFPNNPVVIRALSEARKVVNAIVRRYGSPYEVHIELTRDLSKDFNERHRIEKMQNDNAEQRQRRHDRLQQEFHAIANGLNDLKLRLAIEQDWKCAYSGIDLDKSRIFQDLGYVDIDHIIPYSKSLDDSFANKVLVLASENRQKRDLLPFEYLGGDQDSPKWRNFVAWVEGQIRSFPKKNRLLKHSWTEADMQNFKERNLNDTRYIARFLKNYIDRYLAFRDPLHKSPVVCVNGQLTAFLRTRWGFSKIREGSDLHHALDAAVVAVTGRKLIQSLSAYSHRKELNYCPIEERAKVGFIIDSMTGEIIKDKFPKPWPEFRNDVLEAKNKVFVSRAPRRKISGEAHAQTIVTAKYFHEKQTVVKCRLQDLVVDKATGDFKLFDREHNQHLYRVMRERLNQHDNDPKKAFLEPLYKFAKQGQGPVVKSVKILEVLKSGLAVRQGIAANGDMVRTDVFTKAGKYYLVPLYVADRVKDTLPNKAIAANKPEAEWPEMDASYTFCFSLYPNDFVRLKFKNQEIIEGYYRGCDRSTASIALDCHDRNIQLGKNGTFRGIGVKTAQRFEKFNVSVLGDELTRVHTEKRLPLNLKKAKG